MRYTDSNNILVIFVLNVDIGFFPGGIFLYVPPIHLTFFRAKMTADFFFYAFVFFSRLFAILRPFFRRSRPPPPGPCRVVAWWSQGGRPVNNTRSVGRVSRGGLRFPAMSLRPRVRRDKTAVRSGWLERWGEAGGEEKISAPNRPSGIFLRSREKIRPPTTGRK